MAADALQVRLRHRCFAVWVPELWLAYTESKGFAKNMCQPISRCLAVGGSDTRLRTSTKVSTDVESFFCANSEIKEGVAFNYFTAWKL